MSLPDIGGFLGNLGSSLGGLPGPFHIPSTQPPLYTSLPQAQRALRKKYTNPQMQLALGQLPAPVRTGLVNYDLTRVNRGQQPLSTAQTAGGLSTILNKTPATPNEPEGLLGRIKSDVSALVDVPHMVSGLVQEAMDLPQAPAKLSEVLGRGSPQDILQGLQEVPGIRDIPGVYTVSQAAKGPGALLEHPVFQALDVLPFLKEPVAGLANRALEEGGALGGTETAARVADARTRGAYRLQNEFMQTLGFPAQPEPSNVRLAARQSPLLRTLRASPQGQQVLRAFGYRDLAQLASGEQANLRLGTSPGIPLDRVTELQRPLAEANRAMADYVKVIPDVRRRQLTNAAELNSLDDVLHNRVTQMPPGMERPGPLTDTEQAFLNTANEHSDAIASVAIARKWGLSRLDNDIWTTKQANRILTHRLVQGVHQDVADARGAIRTTLGEGNHVADGSIFPTIDTGPLLREGVGKRAVKSLGDMYGEQVRLAGFDNSMIRDAVTAKRPTAQAIIDAIDQTRAQADALKRPLLTPDEVQAKIGPEAFRETRKEKGSKYSMVQDNLRRGNYSAAVDNFRGISQRTKFAHPDEQIILESLQAFRDADKAVKLAEERGFRNDALRRHTNRLTKLEAQSIPARFHPRIMSETRNLLMAKYGTDAESLQRITEGSFGLIPAIREHPQLLNDIQREALGTVQQLRSEGFDPLFVHRVSQGQVPEIFYPHLSDVLRSPTFAKQRTFDATPYVHDAAISVSHLASEAMTRMSVEHFIDAFMQVYGQDKVRLMEEFRPLAQRMAEADPSLDVHGHIEQLVKREYKEYDPVAIFPTKQVWLKTHLKEHKGVLIPKATERVLADMFRSPGSFTSTLDPLMNTFRMSVLAFSPRFQVYNILGGFMLLGAQSPGALVYGITHMRKVRDFIKGHEMEQLAGAPPGGMGQVPVDMAEWVRKATPWQKVFAGHQVLAGRTWARWLADRGQSGQPGFLRKAAGKSFEMNGWVDDAYRAVAYLSEHDKALTKGMSHEVAQQHGLALLRKVLPEWDRITPFERNVIRNIFPFYTFAKFIVGYSMQYPMDHPVRMAVAANLVKNEYHDFGDWLPSRFASMFFLGKPDANGNVSALTPAGLNPFTDVANYFSLSGYLGKMNPLISTVLESVGVNPSSGVQDLYPDIAYDPVTGALKPKNPNLISTLISNIIPQTNVVSALIGQNKDFQGMLQANPEAAASYLRQSIGLPNLSRTINVPTEAIKGEVQRQSAQDTVRNEALRTGDWSRAMKFPKLRPFFDKLKGLMDTNPQLFSAYQTATKKNTGDAFFTALVTRNVPGQG